ncbi:hypothetical protein HK405_006762, partial [Cladochytrium tenue]
VSANCMREMDLAADERKPMIPVRTDNGPFLRCAIITAGLLYADLANNKAGAERAAKLEQLADEIVRRVAPPVGARPALLLPASETAALVAEGDGGTSHAPVATAPVAAAEADCEVLRSLREKLRPLDFDGDIIERSSRRLPGTREHVLHDIRGWLGDDERLDTANADAAVLWLQGAAGTGKSVVHASITRELEQAQRLAATFRCDRAVAERCSPRRVLTTLGYQIVRRAGAEAQRDLDAAVGVEEVHGWPLAALFEVLVARPLQAMAGQRKVVVTIDALDELARAVDGGNGAESGSGERTEFLRVLAEGWQNVVPAGVRLVVTGRPDDDVRRTFGGFEVCELRLDSPSNLRDIEAYSAHRMGGLRHRLAAPTAGHTVDELVRELAGRMAGLADRLFIWIVVAYDEILCSWRVRDVAKEVERLAAAMARPAGVDAAVPSALGALYGRVFDEAFGAMAEDELGLVRVVLGAIRHLRRPLSESGLAGLLNVPVAEVRWVLLPLNSLLDCSGETVKLLHKSVADYLGSGLAPAALRTDSSSAEMALFKKCVDVLAAANSTVFGGREAWVLAGVEEAVGASEIVEYAASYWHEHLVAISDVEVGDWDALSAFRRRSRFGPGLLAFGVLHGRPDAIRLALGCSKSRGMHHEHSKAVLGANAALRLDAEKVKLLPSPLLYEAAKSGDAESCAILLECAGADVGCRGASFGDRQFGEHNWTALHVSAFIESEP